MLKACKRVEEAGLRVLSVMCQRGLPLSEIRRAFTPYPQVNLDVKVKEKRPFDAMPKVAAAMADAESALGTRGRILVRYSGTESLARVMVEAEDSCVVDSVCQDLADAVVRGLG